MGTTRNLHFGLNSTGIGWNKDVIHFSIFRDHHGKNQFSGSNY